MATSKDLCILKEVRRLVNPFIAGPLNNKVLCWSRRYTFVVMIFEIFRVLNVKFRVLLGVVAV